MNKETNIIPFFIDYFPLIDENRNINIDKEAMDRLNNEFIKSIKSILLDSKQIDNDIAKIIDEHFWEMI